MGEGRVPGPILPLIAVPTTAGTGSEVTHAGILTDTENNIKVAIASNYLRPRAAVVDPLMTVTCPPKPTADSGIDALTHAVEAFMATDSSHLEIPEGEVSIYQGRNPLGNALVEPAVGLIARHLADAVRNGQDLDAREGMHLAALIAGMGFSNVGVGAVHALEYPIGGAVHCSHGCGNGLLAALCNGVQQTGPGGASGPPGRTDGPPGGGACPPRLPPTLPLSGYDP